MSQWLLLERVYVRKKRGWVKIRVYITIGVLITYVALFNLYMYELDFIPIKNSKLFYNYITFGMLLFALLDLKCGFVSFMHKQFNLICFICLLINYVIIILTHHTILRDCDPIFYSFNGAVMAVTIMIGSSIYRHGYKD